MATADFDKINMKAGSSMGGAALRRMQEIA